MNERGDGYGCVSVIVLCVLAYVFGQADGEKKIQRQAIEHMAAAEVDGEFRWNDELKDKP